MATMLQRSILLSSALGGGARALTMRQAGCTFHINTEGTVSGPVGQYESGQTRTGPDDAPSSFTINGDTLTDGQNRGCWWTPPALVLQCDVGQIPEAGFTIGCDGTVSYNGLTTFYNCDTGVDGLHMIYLAPNGSNCGEITLTADGCYPDSCGGAGETPGSGTTPGEGSPTEGGGGYPTGGSESTPTGDSGESGETAAPGGESTPAPTGGEGTPTGGEGGSGGYPTGGTGETPGGGTPGAGEGGGYPTGGGEGPGAGGACPTQGGSGGTAPGSGGETSAPGGGAGGGYPTGGEGTSPGAAEGTPTNGGGETTPTGGSGESTPGNEGTTPGGYPTGDESTPTNGGGETTLTNGGGEGTTSPGGGSGGGYPTGGEGSTPGATPTGSSSGGGSGSSGAPSGPGQTGAPGGGSCPGELGSTYQYPHLIIPVDSSNADSAPGTSYFGEVSPTLSSAFNFDIPGSYSGKTCTVVFYFPEQSQLETSSYTFSGSGSIECVRLSGPVAQDTCYSNLPSVRQSYGTQTVAAGNAYTITSFECPAGEAVAFKLSTAGSDTSFRYFQDYNPCPIGLFITAS